MSKNRGFASIVVSLILVLVFSLITLGFATISRREQQNALNKQLSTQAEYAAESWINSKLRSGSLDAINTCAQTDYDAANNVKVTCGLIKRNLSSTPATISGPTSGTSIPFTPTAGQSVTKFTITWKSSNAAKKSPLTSMNNPFNDTLYNSPSIVQISITPIKESALSRDCLINKTFNAFLYPGNSTATPNIASMPALNCPNAGAFPQPAPANKYFGRCDGSGNCTIDIYVDPVNRLSDKFLFRFLAPYGAPSESTNIKVTGSTNSFEAGGAPTVVTDSGTVILDVTAKAQDVVKRIQVAVPVTVVTSSGSSSMAPEYLIQADSACKRLVDQEITTTPPASKSYTSIFSSPTAYTGSGCNLLNADL
jgi:Tfp pilus assembly protein PilX